MTEPSQIIPPINPDTSAQISTVRRAALVMAAIASAGLVGWLATSGRDTRSESAASIERDTALQRSLFREENGRIYVSVPAARQPAAEAHVGGTDAPVVVAALPAPERRPQRAPAAEPTPASPVVPPPATRALSEPREPTAVEPRRVEPAPGEQTPAEQMTNETMNEPAPTESLLDQPAWDEPTPSDSMQDEPAWDDSTMDESDDEDEPMTDESDEQSDSDD